MGKNEPRSDSDVPTSHGSKFEVLWIGKQKWSQEDLAHAIVQDRLTPAEHSLVSDHFWTIGFKTIKKQLRTGELAHASARIGRPVTFQHDDQRQLSGSVELRDELAAEILISAVPNFFKRSEERRVGKECPV